MRGVAGSEVVAQAPVVDSVMSLGLRKRYLATLSGQAPIVAPTVSHFSRTICGLLRLVSTPRAAS